MAFLNHIGAMLNHETCGFFLGAHLGKAMLARKLLRRPMLAQESTANLQLSQDRVKCEKMCKEFKTV